MKKKYLLIGIGIILLVIIMLPVFIMKKLVSTLPRSSHYFELTNFPEISEWKKQSYCRMSPEEKEKYNQRKIEEARALSDKLEGYIREWYYGNAKSEIPSGLLPPSIDNEKTRNWRLLRPEEVNPEDQWFVRPANEIPEDFSKIYLLSTDNHASYLRLIFIAPFDSRLLVEGDFPHARFMDYQILEPFDPENPTTTGHGAPEVSIVDVDIEPDPGHINPFRAGADRNTKNRHYHLTFDLKAGNAIKLNPQAMQTPAYRGPGNTRVGGPFAFSGPLGDGSIIPAVLWVRYYAPDKNVGPLGGVGLPKVLLRLSTGETFWLQPDFSLTEERWNMAVPGYSTSPEEPFDFNGPTVGWFKDFGFSRIYTIGMTYPWVRPWGIFPKNWGEKLVNSLDECYFGRGSNMPPPGNYEKSATSMNYHTYLVRVMSLGENKAYALTGKLPITPKTRDSEPITTTGEARYWSICHVGHGEDRKYPGMLYGCLMDDEILTDSNNNYIMVFSRGEERPANAKLECGVTWQDYGPESRQNFNIRWTSVIPDDYLPEFAPHQNNIPWETGDWASPDFDPSIMFYNNQDGFMKEYQPLVHYLTKEEFEALGCPVDPKQIPEWK